MLNPPIVTITTTNSSTINRADIKSFYVVSVKSSLLSVVYTVSVKTVENYRLTIELDRTNMNTLLEKQALELINNEGVF